jgi:hypothetical protein
VNKIRPAEAGTPTIGVPPLGGSRLKSKPNRLKPGHQRDYSLTDSNLTTRSMCDMTIEASAELSGRLELHSKFHWIEINLL